MADAAHIMGSVKCAFVESTGLFLPFCVAYPTRGNKKNRVGRNVWRSLPKDFKE